MTRYLHSIPAMLVVAAVYFCAGKFGLSLAFVNASASAVWPPTGLALAALLLWGYRLWPGIFLGAFLVNITTQGSTATSLGIAVGNTLEALLAAGLVQRFANGLRAFDRAQTIFKFAGFAAVLSTAVSATVGVTSLTLGGFGTRQQYGSIWLTWWLGDLVSDLIVAPLLVVWATQASLRLSPRERIEAAGLLLTVVLVGEMVFLGRVLFGPSHHSMEYLAIPPLLWAAFRFGQRGAITAAAIISGIALWGTLHQLGPFATADPNRSLLLLQSFMGTITLTALVLAAVVAERRRAEQRFQVQAAVSRVLADSPTLIEATPRILQALCETGQWETGAIWGVDRPANELFCVEVWHRPPKPSSEFEAMTRQIRFAPGKGLPGRVWSSGKPVWIPDVTQDANFPRAPVAAKEGLHGAFCFPLKLGDEIVGLIDCFSCEVRPPDEDFLQMIAVVGNQVGQFIERKKSEKALQEAKDKLAQHALELERIVAERTAKLTESNAELEAFSYSLSHDMRAPLRAIQSFTQIVLADNAKNLAPGAAEFLKKVISASQRLDRLILDVLALSRFSRQEIQIGKVDIEKLVREIIHERPELQPPRAEVTVEGPLLPMLGHEAFLTQCLTNLLGNAVKFVAAGVRPQVRIYSTSVGDQARLWVQDNGIGIEPAAHQRVFEIFQRFHSNNHYEGNGIGLAIVRKAVERMGGQTGVESALGQGSRFWLQLPQAKLVPS